MQKIILLAAACVIYLCGYAQQPTKQPPVIDTIIVIDTTLAEEELEEVTISSTRTGRTILNTPTRVETIDEEEIDEKINMRPANVAMILHESTGIQVQQTSATTGNATIRIQGLDGRYTQLLKDGYPSFGNFAAGLSVLEIPPLDLKQVEIIKGPASTLYGGGAVSGVVNFISKTPGKENVQDFLLNYSTANQANIGAFFSGKNSKVGYTILGLYNRQTAYDVDDDGFTELPDDDNFTINPKLFFYLNERLRIIIGNSLTATTRTGGDVQVIKGSPGPNDVYFERNKTFRNTATLEIDRKSEKGVRLNFKSAFSIFNRKINLPGFEFAGINSNVYTELTALKNLPRQTILFGANFIYDRFDQKRRSANSGLDFTTTTGGLFAQHTWDITNNFKLESGLRADLLSYRNPYYSDNEILILPRVSVLYKLTDDLSGRVGGGLGYKSPSAFTEETERFQYQGILPLNNVESERSYGGTADINYAKRFGNFSLSLNQMFFVTDLQNALQLQYGVAGAAYSNSAINVRSRGFETNFKIVFKDALKLFSGYTYSTVINEAIFDKRNIPLAPRHKINMALVYEKERNIKLGLEGYFTGRQNLSDGSVTPSFWEFGAAAEKTFGKVSVFVNAENFTDVRQSRYKRVVNGPDNDPTFDEIWTNTEGFIFNGGIKLKL